MLFLRFILGLGLLFAVTAQAQVNMPDPQEDIPLTESELKTAFKGQTHRGTYNFKRVSFRTFGFEETTRKDGRVEHQQDGHTDTGSYTINDDLICFIYDPNERGEFARFNPICFNIYRRGNCYYHYQRSVSNRPVSGFTARSVIKGDNPDCAPQIS
ncbi:hypothetical protein [Hellea balneolensis]|uniref:hypothetical protein n=1 Tax=Hellea balneolensis TaxID=287478 RepID=UPI0004046BA7|nr:hypothetical protein [Hellea balneolensis]